MLATGQTPTKAIARCRRNGCPQLAPARVFNCAGWPGGPDADSNECQAPPLATRGDVFEESPEVGSAVCDRRDSWIPGRCAPAPYRRPGPCGHERADCPRPYIDLSAAAGVGRRSRAVAGERSPSHPGHERSSRRICGARWRCGASPAGSRTAMTRGRRSVPPPSALRQAPSMSRCPRIAPRRLSAPGRVVADVRSDDDERYCSLSSGITARAVVGCGDAGPGVHRR
jgi:hypothetical protein